jgi:hypothetical protein
MEIRRTLRLMSKIYPTDAELAAALEKIMAAVRETIADFKDAAPPSQGLSDGEWAKLKRDENRRRRRMK